MSIQFQNSIVVPVYNNKAGIRLLWNELHSVFQFETTEFIFVDDFSVDGSWNELVELKKEFPLIKIIRLSKNVGQHLATVCGIQETSGKFVLTLDDDLIVKPKEFLKLLDYQMESSHKVVYGEYKSQNTFSTGLLKKIYKSFSKVEGKNRGRGSSFRLIDGDLARSLALNHKSYVFIDELVLWYTHEIGFVSVQSNLNPLTKSRYSKKSLFSSTFDLIMYSTDFPLRIVMFIGLFMSIINFCIGAFILYKKFVHKITEQGYASLIVSVLFSTGLIILCIGIISIYMRKLMRSQNNEPLFYISDKQC